MHSHAHRFCRERLFLNGRATFFNLNKDFCVTSFVFPIFSIFTPSLPSIRRKRDAKFYIFIWWPCFTVLFMSSFAQILNIHIVAFIENACRRLVWEYCRGILLICCYGAALIAHKFQQSRWEIKYVFIKVPSALDLSHGWAFYRFSQPLLLPQHIKLLMETFTTQKTATNFCLISKSGAQISNPTAICSPQTGTVAPAFIFPNNPLQTETRVRSEGTVSSPPTPWSTWRICTEMNPLIPMGISAISDLPVKLPPICNISRICLDVC